MIYKENKRFDVIKRILKDKSEHFTYDKCFCCEKEKHLFRYYNKRICCDCFYKIQDDFRASDNKYLRKILESDMVFYQNFRTEKELDTLSDMEIYWTLLAHYVITNKIAETIS